jgi:hypothetical protein
MGEGFGLFKKAIRPFGNAERNTPRRKKKKTQQKNIKACEWEIGCIWGFGFVSVLSLFCILPF